MHNKAKLDYIVNLHKKNSDNLGFIPKPFLEKLVDNGQFFLSKDGGLESGYCIVGNGKNSNLNIYQHCIEIDLRRLTHGKLLFKEVEHYAKNKGYDSVTLRCRENLQANKFWKALNFINYGFEAKVTKRTKKGINKWIYLIQNPKQFQLFRINYGKQI